MADDRRTPRGQRPRSRTGPGRSSGPSRRTPSSPGARPSDRPADRAADRAADRSGRAPGPPGPRRTRRPRLTGRAAILVLVLAVLTVSYASSLRAYLQQRQHINDLNAQIAETGQDIQQLEREKRRWDDDSYVAQQARQRLNYVFVGEKSYVFLGEDGKPIEPGDTLSETTPADDRAPTAWWSTTWKSVEAAGHPPSATDRQKPAGTIEAPSE